MLYEVITMHLTHEQIIMLHELARQVWASVQLNSENRKTQKKMSGITAKKQRNLAARQDVITSYSIHYTKLYDVYRIHLFF